MNFIVPGLIALAVGLLLKYLTTIAVLVALGSVLVVVGAILLVVGVILVLAAAMGTRAP